MPSPAGHPAAHPQQQPAPSHADPRGYDLGAYTPPDGPPGGRQPAQQWQPAFGETSAGRGAARGGDASFDGPAFGTPYPGGPPGKTLPAVDRSDADDIYEDDEEEEPRRPRYMLIAASIVLAIAAGGTLAYAYKVLFAPPQQIGGTPVVKVAGPARVKPAEPGGTKFANTDSRVVDQAAGGNPDGGPRIVRSVPIGPDGAIASGSGSPPGAEPRPPMTPPPSLAAATVQGTVSATPGISVVIPGGPPPGAVRPPPLPPAGPPIAVSPPPQAAPQPPPVRTLAAPPTVPSAARSPQPPIPVAPAVEQEPPAVPKSAAAPKAPAPPVGVGAGAAGSPGFVAVLASVPATNTSRVAAMRQFTTTQQKYPTALAGKVPDVVEAQLTRGTYHRLVVGPPASKETALQICADLKAAGYTAACWVTAL
jgi:hypothetical protein